jgi:hypothetical protein
MDWDLLVASSFSGDCVCVDSTHLLSHLPLDDHYIASIPFLLPLHGGCEYRVGMGRGKSVVASCQSVPGIESRPFVLGNTAF